MITRKEYMSQYPDGPITHDDYYSQFVTPETFESLVRFIPQDTIESSEDDHLNDIQLRRWDNLPIRPEWRPLLRDAGEILSMSTVVCIYKRAANIIRDSAWRPMSCE